MAQRLKAVGAGLLIVFEGIDGAGKSTVAADVAEQLRSDGREVLVTREPSGTAVGMHVREFLRDRNHRLTPETEYLLFAADRSAHLAEVVRPALARGALVLCDRMGDSSVAYQGYGHGVDLVMIERCNTWIMGDVAPHRTVYLAIDYATAHARVLERKGQQFNCYDYEHGSFFSRVIAGYEALYAQRSDVIRVDATHSRATVVQEVYTALRKSV